MSLDIQNIKIISAEKKNENHKKWIWKIRNENLDFNLITTKAISYENHSEWWENVFDKEYVYLIMNKNDICGYIRLTKDQSSTKEKNEISIAIAKQIQNIGIGSYAYKLFENEMIKLGIKKIIAITHKNNNAGKNFFEKNKFEKKIIIEHNYIKYVKKL
ncbi:MAG: GNAT family N-acetyltransferase [Promethearchaeota archaeon]